MTPDETDPLSRGTKVILKLKENMQEYLEERRLKAIVNKYSESISFPIELQLEKSKPNSEEEDKKDEEEPRVNNLAQ